MISLAPPAPMHPNSHKSLVLCATPVMPRSAEGARSGARVDRQERRQVNQISSPHIGKVYLFDDFSLDANGILKQADRQISLPPKEVAVLRTLLEAS